MSTSKRKHAEAAEIREIKPEIRVLGIDDGAFIPHSRGQADVVGVVFRGGHWLEGFMHTRVQVDGMDSTEKLAQMIVGSSHYKQLRVIMLNGVTLAGFNVVDIMELQEKVKLPVIAVTRDKPSFEDIRKAVQHLPQTEDRWEAIKKAGEVIEVYTREREEPVYMHAVGITIEMAKRVLRSTSTRSNVPEALRVAHIIASGLKQS